MLNYSSLRRVGDSCNRWTRILAYYLLRLFFIILAFLSSVALFMVLYSYAIHYQFESVGLVALTPLALIIGLSGLMYNRARSIELKSQRFRSLYAAERLMTSCYAYLIAIILGFVVTVFLQPFMVGNQLTKLTNRDTLLLIYSPSMFLCVFSFVELLHVIFAMRPHLPRHFKSIARTTKRLLDKSE